MSPGNKSAAERLAVARTELAAAKQQIAELDKRLQAALLADADGAAAAAYDERREARDLAERLALKIELLAPIAGAELCRREGSGSSDVEGRRRLLRHWQEQVRRPEIEDAELDELRAKISFLETQT